MPPTREIRLTPVASLPQLVPSHACFRCDVCCRFPESDSFLRPYFTGEETRRAIDAGLDSSFFPDPDGGQIELTPNQHGEGYLCPAFDPGTAHCRIYAVRPLDCQIYPLALMWNQDRSQVVLGWDQKCPFLAGGAGDSGAHQQATGREPHDAGSPAMQSGRATPLSPSPSLVEYAESIAERVEGEDTLKSIIANPRVIGPYQDDVVILRRLRHLTAAISVAPALPRRSAKLTALTLDHRPLVEQALISAGETMGTTLSAYAFAPHYIWRSLFRYWWAEIEEHLCLFAEHEDGLFMVLPPLGPGPLSLPLAGAFDLMREHNHGSGVTRVENIPEELKPTFEALGYRVDPKDPDFLYGAADLVALAGDAYKSQRADCNRLARTGQIQYEPFCDRDLQPCLALLHLWRRQKSATGLETIGRHMLNDAEAAHREALLHHGALGLIGRVLRVNGALQGYTFGYERSPSVFCVLLEIADRTVRGVAQTLFREFCREAVDRGYQFINTMDACGLPSVAQSKRAYRPIAMVPSYTASEQR